MIDHLYINGCSFTNDHSIINQSQLQFGDHIAQGQGWQLTNAGEPGSCNRRIIRKTLKDSQEFGSNTLVMVSLTMLSRTEMNVYDLWNHNDPMMIKEDFFQSIKLQSQDLIYQNYRNAWFKNYSEYGEFVDLATDVLMLSGYLQNQGIPYLIYAYCPLIITPGLRETLEKLPMYRALSQDHSVIDLLNDSLISRLGPGSWWYDGKTSGHLHAQGHAHAGNILLGLINSTHKCY
jgi:hypothetical protein